MAKPSKPFGANAVNMGFATPDQVEKALEYQRGQRAKGRHILLGLAMKKLGFITKQQMFKIVGQSQSREFALSEDAIHLAVRIKTALGDDKRVVVLTSAAEREGVSTIAYQIALSLALMEDGQTLLIDANYRSPSMNSYVQQRQPAGESNGNEVKGLSDVKITRIAAAMELGLRLTRKRGDAAR